MILLQLLDPNIHAPTCLTNFCSNWSRSELDVGVQPYWAVIPNLIWWIHRRISANAPPITANCGL